ncbi:hypothetical protein FGIG_05877 [Fasciola gigantica]|uniref:Uncharacterized protein n=1 Tax=Fasciola gigantica TaxID=46835 RepID=A0A504Z077_FASGI|nr:hypothetical protein FGIG_05877 [Fasciola gigantica]
MQMVQKPPSLLWEIRQIFVSPRTIMQTPPRALPPRWEESLPNPMKPCLSRPAYAKRKMWTKLYGIWQEK